MIENIERYETEIVIPPTRQITLQLPSSLPVGRARVVVETNNLLISSGLRETSDAGEFDRHDVEWWDDFDDRD
jgi:hypothetical protein